MGGAPQIGRTGALEAQVAANDNWSFVTQGSLERIALTVVVPVACEKLFKSPLVAVKAHYDNELR